MSYQTLTQEGPGTVEERVSDYRDVDGIRMPFKSESYAKDKKTSAQTVKKIEINPELGDDLFQIE